MVTLKKPPRPTKPNIIRIGKADFYSGAGMVRAIPGPVFSVATYMGGIAMKDRGTSWQILGCFIAATGIFLPSALLVLFFYPIWNNLKKYAIVYRALEGINAVVVALAQNGVKESRMGAAGYSMFQPTVANKDETSRRKNRRVEIFVLAPDAVVAGWDPNWVKQ